MVDNSGFSDDFCKSEESSVPSLPDIVESPGANNAYNAWCKLLN